MGAATFSPARHGDLGSRVIRTNTGHLRAGGKWFRCADIAQAAFDAVSRAGSRNPAFDMPPLCYTGSPHADIIIGLGCEEVDEPASYFVEVTPPLGNVWRKRKPIWPEVFSADPDSI